MVNSCTGKMGHAAAEAIVQAGFPLIPMSFTGLSMGVAVHNVGVRGVPVQLVDAAKRQAVMDTLKEQYPGLLVVDFTLPHLVQGNATFYAANGLHFVMGTTVTDPEGLQALVEAAGTYAVVASREWREVAGLRAVLHGLGVDAASTENLPSLRFEVLDSRRPIRGSPGDQTGTMRPRTAGEMTEALKVLGIQADEAKVARSWRSKSSAPQCTYRICLPDRSRCLTFHYDTNARRDIYAQGTVEALSFLSKRVAERHPQHVYDILEVFEAKKQQQAAAKAGGGGGGGGGPKAQLVTAA